MIELNTRILLVSYLGFTSNDLGRRAVTFQDDLSRRREIDTGGSENKSSSEGDVEGSNNNKMGQ